MRLSRKTRLYGPALLATVALAAAATAAAEPGFVDDL